MATISAQAPAAAGSGSFPTLTAAAAGGDQYRNSGREMLVVANGGGGAVTVTYVQQRACNQGFGSPTHDVAQTVAAGATEWFPPVSPTYFNDDDGFVQITYSGVTDVTVGIVKAV